MADNRLHIVKNAPARFVLGADWAAGLLTGYLMRAALVNLSEQTVASISEGSGIERTQVGGFPQFTLSFTADHTKALTAGARLVVSLEKAGEQPLQDFINLSVSPNLIP